MGGGRGGTKGRERRSVVRTSGGGFSLLKGKATKLEKKTFLNATTETCNGGGGRIRGEGRVWGRRSRREEGEGAGTYKNISSSSPNGRFEKVVVSIKSANKRRFGRRLTRAHKLSASNRHVQAHFNKAETRFKK